MRRQNTKERNAHTLAEGWGEVTRKIEEKSRASDEGRQATATQHKKLVGHEAEMFSEGESCAS